MPDVLLVDPQGRPWVAGSAAEVTDLVARGYRLVDGSSPAVDGLVAPEPVVDSVPAPEPAVVAAEAPVTEPEPVIEIPTVEVLPEPAPVVEVAPEPVAEAPFGIVVS